MLGARSQILLVVVGMVLAGFALIVMAAEPLLGELAHSLQADPDTLVKVEAVRTLILLFMALAVVLVTILGYTALTQLIVRPLDRTMRAIEKVQAGDLGAHAVPSGGREMRELAAAFNRLARKLEADDARIERQIAELRITSTQLEQAQDSLVRSEKLASVGRLAAGVAHEIGNPIGIVLGYLEMLKDGEVTEEERHSWVEQCIEQTHRVNQIIRDLLDFSRPSSGDGVEVGEAGRVVRATLALLAAHERFKTVTVRNEASGDGSWPVAIADNRLQQVLVNVLLNAADAAAAAASPEVRVEVGQDDAVVTIRITDNGAGVPEELRHRIFDPFFTTKEVGTGTGLGLGICHTILTSCGGDIALETNKGGGATFVVSCPAIDSGEAA